MAKTELGCGEGSGALTGELRKAPLSALKQQNPPLRILLIPLDTSQQVPLRGQPLRFGCGSLLMARQGKLTQQGGRGAAPSHSHPPGHPPSPCFSSRALTLAVNFLITNWTALMRHPQEVTGAAHTILAGSLCAPGCCVTIPG